MTKIIKTSNSRKVVTTHRRAFAKYHILETMEAGMVLTGPEVKSLRAGLANLQDSYVLIADGQATLLNVHINPYAHGSLHVQQQPRRSRRLLLNKSEILKWMGRTTAKGLTIVPLEIYFNKKGRAKISLGLAKAKVGPDRREELRRRTVNREIQREFGGKGKIK